MKTLRAYYCEKVCLWGFRIFQQGAVIYRSEARYLDELTAKFEGRKKAGID